MADFKFNCPGCGQHIQMHVKYAGKNAICPGCNQPFRVPVPAAGTPTVPTPPKASAPSEGVPVPSPPQTHAARAPRSRAIPTIIGFAVIVGGGLGAWLGVHFARRTSDLPPAPAPSLPAPKSPQTAQTGDTKPISGTATDGFAWSDSAPWPQWRGPLRDGRSPETGLLRDWPVSGPPLLWKADQCGEGYSSVAVAGGLVFTLGDFSDGSHVLAFEESTGNLKWTSTKLGDTGGNYEGTKSTPTLDGRRLYALGQFGDLVSLDASTGDLLWKVQLRSDLGGEFSQWNYAESPLVDGDKVIVTPGGRAGSVVALNKNNGSLIWRSRQWTDEPQYVSAIASEIGGRRHYVQLSQHSLVGLDASTGEIFWRIPRRGATAVIPTPVISGNIIFVTSGYNVGCNAFQINATNGRVTTRQLYANTDLVNHHGGVVLVDGHIYGHSDRGGWKCLDLATGRVRWENRGIGKGSVIYADGHLICRSETGSGNIALVEATPDGYREKSRFAQPDRSGRNSWAHPVIANGRLYLRDQNVLLCYNLRP
jgi:outer membrane protein assembly factor BamB